jgi:hypothetical protein
MNKLGVFFTCYDELEATRYSLSCIKNVYPDIKTYLVTEGNLDFTFLEREISHLKVNPVADTMSPVFPITIHDYLTPSNQAALRIAVSAIIQRLKQAIEYHQCEYTIMLDPDAIVRGPLTIKEGAGLLGCRINSNPPLFRKLNDMLLANGGIELTAWGATPAIFRSEDFLRAAKIFEEKDLLSTYCQSFYWAFAHDVLLPTLFSLIGREEEFNPELVQCELQPELVATGAPLLHQVRTYYPKRKSKYKANE